MLIFSAVAMLFAICVNEDIVKLHGVFFLAGMCDLGQVLPLDNSSSTNVLLVSNMESLAAHQWVLSHL